MKPQVSLQHKPVALALATMLLTVAGCWSSATQAALGAEPRLSFSDDPLAQTNGGAADLTRSDTQNIGELQRSLKLLVGSASGVRSVTDLACKERSEYSQEKMSVHAAQCQSVAAWPRLTGSIDKPLTQNGAPAFIASVLGDPRHAWRGIATTQVKQQAIHASARRQTTERISDISVSGAGNTSARSFLALSSIGPRLFDSGTDFLPAAKAPRRPEVVATSTKRTTSRPLVLDTPTLEIKAPIAAPLPDIASTQTAPTLVSNLTAPVGPVELGNMNADDQRTELSSDDPEYDMSVLDGATLASLEPPVGAEQLQETRAGFVLNNGIQIDFSVTRLTTIDGVGRLQTLANLPQGLDQSALAQISAGQAGASQVPALADGSAIFTIVQNNLDNQKILDVTTLDIDIKNFGLRSLDFIPSHLQRDAVPAEFR